jgi:endogenous inhibitor of DNA gyrase (YacG/DUF329 family)
MIKQHCPICQKVMEVLRLSDWPAFPFCSARCRMIDLGRWLGQEYRIPLGPEETEEGAEPGDTPVP